MKNYISVYFVNVFDIGTLTTGSIKISEIIDLSGKGVDYISILAGSIEFRSSHPIAKAIVQYCKNSSIL